MSCILYCYVGDQIATVRVNGAEVGDLLTKGYASSPEQLAKRKKADTNNTGKLSDAEIKAAAKEAGIKVGRKSIKTLIKELGL